MRVLITGGSGFIGTHLVNDLLRDGALVWNVDRRAPLDPNHHRYWFQGDILERRPLKAAFRTFMPTHVVHLAARTDQDEKRSLDGYQANIEGTRWIIDAACDTPQVLRTIIASCMEVCRLGYRPRHDTDYMPPNLYGQSKVLTEQLVREAAWPSCWTLIRPTTIWGPGQDRLRDGLLRMVQNGLYVHPAGKPVMKSYGYVGNTVYQIRRLLEAPVEQVDRRTFYVSDPPINLQELVSAFSRRLTGQEVRCASGGLMRAAAYAGDLLKLLGLPAPLTSFRLRNMTVENVVDTAPIDAIAGRLPYSVEQGIEETVRWLEDPPCFEPIAMRRAA